MSNTFFTSKEAYVRLRDQTREGTLLAPKVAFVQQTFEKADLHGLVASGSRWRDVQIQHTNLRGADLAGSSFEGGSMAHVDFEGSDLTGASFSSDVKLARVSFRECEMGQVRFTGVTMSGANFYGANMQGCHMGVNVTTPCGVFIRADLTGANLYNLQAFGSTFRSADLSSANLQECDLTGVDFNYANLQGTDLRGAFLDGATLTYASMRGSKFGSEEELRRVNLYPIEMALWRVLDVLTLVFHREPLKERLLAYCKCLQKGEHEQSLLSFLGLFTSEPPFGTMISHLWRLDRGSLDRITVARFAAFNEGDTPENNPRAAILRDWLKLWLR